MGFRFPAFHVSNSERIASTKEAAVSSLAIVPEDSEAYQWQHDIVGNGEATIEHPLQTASAEAMWVDSWIDGTTRIFAFRYQETRLELGMRP